MIKQIKEIKNTGEVVFLTPAGKEVSGDRKDCNSYGYKTLGGKCYAFERKNKRVYFNRLTQLGKGLFSKVVGYRNRITGALDAFILGNDNVIEKEKGIVIGNFGQATTSGQIVFSAGKELARNQVSIIQLTGQTTDASSTDLFTAGGEQFCLVLSKDAIFHIKMVGLGYTTAGSNATLGYTVSRNYAYRYDSSNKRIVEIATNSAEELKDSHCNYAVALGFDTETGQYEHDRLTCRVTGATSQTVEWQVTLQITELHITV